MTFYKNMNYFAVEAVFLTERAAALFGYVLATVYPNDKKWIEFKRQYDYKIVRSYVSNDIYYTHLLKKYEIYKKLDRMWYDQYINSDTYKLLQEIEELCANE